MSYDDNFYKAYSEYLQDPIVVERHTLAVKFLHDPRYVVDLGCGHSSEILSRLPSKPCGYQGYDVNATHGNGVDRRVIRDDYRRKDFFKKYLCEFSGFDTFVSLFSVEITGQPIDNYRIYDQFFENGFTQGLVSGFYYSSKKHINPVIETGGLLSFQTLEPPESVVRPDYTESRLIMPVPSALFGLDVYEVWKLFLRRS